VTEKRAGPAPKTAGIPRAFGFHRQSLVDGGCRILTLSMVTHFSSFTAGLTHTEETRLSLGRSHMGFASRPPSETFRDIAFRTAAIQSMPRRE
jgi:hypothetical protein